ncbi:IclR family transcriptional regulator [Candidatus Micrarchaeota archaeon]|nr:IclR family transcriptional regulator [Candidatus Micrarchaeota archaeon]
MKKAENNNFPRTVDKALRMLDALAEADGPQGIYELGKKLSINKSTTYRILRALFNHGYVIQNPQTAKYELGYKVLKLSHSLLKKKGVREIARPLLEKLAKETSETVGLAMLDDNEVVYLDQVNGGEVIRLDFRLGSRWPLHATAAGKACMAYMDHEHAKRIMTKKKLKSYTEFTSTDPEEIFEELKLVRKNGYASNNGEFQREIKAVGAPILNADERPVGAVVLAIPRERFPEDMIPVFGGKVAFIGKEISKMMGT